jgi:glycosyltransferase involved in cell wall biosynthesis
MTRILFLVRSLDVGGAEQQLVALVKGLDKARFESVVATYYPGGALRSALNGVAGVRVISLEKRGRWDVVGFLLRLIRLVREVKPDLLYGYMGIANELALLMASLFRRKVAFGVRASDVDYFRYGWIQGWTFRLGAMLSRYADCVIVNSRAGWVHCARKGYRKDRMVVVPNGIDTDRFRPDEVARARIRAELSARDGDLLVGLAARLDPIKDHPTFLAAAARLAAERTEARFVCVGGGPDEYRDRMRELQHRLGLGERVLWLGERSDMPAVFNALDVACCSSLSEGHPNVVSEAMACGVPCVVTDVGDAAWIVGQAGMVVPAGNPERLAEGLLTMLRSRDRAQIGAAARKRIVQNFSVPALARATGQVLENVMSGQLCS